MRLEDPPEGWPGLCWLEGRTLLHVPEIKGQAEWRKGPATRRESSVFHNVAMSGNRTRSVLLLGIAIEKGWLRADGDIRALDSLCSSAVRSRRWLNEIPAELACRLKVTAVDRAGDSLAWGRSSHAEHPPLHIDPNTLIIRQGDARQLVFEGGWQWVDIDPYGSPIPFLDAAMQNLARKAVIEVSATDTAALCGSYPQVTRRRYAAGAVNDELAHDTAMRILLGNIALCASRHERYIEPLLSVFDGHHVRVSVLVRPGRKRASEVHLNLGWRVSAPDSAQVECSIAAGLHDFDCVDVSQPRAFLPWNSPPSSLDPDVASGPLWTGALASPELLRELTSERALEWCGLDMEADADLLARTGWAQNDVRISNRGVERSVKRLCQWADAVHTSGIITMDELPRWVAIPGPPSVSKLVELLRLEGFAAAISPLSAPAIQTDAPWDVMLRNAEACLDN